MTESSRLSSLKAMLKAKRSLASGKGRRISRRQGLPWPVAMDLTRDSLVFGGFACASLDWNSYLSRCCRLKLPNASELWSSLDSVGRTGGVQLSYGFDGTRRRNSSSQFSTSNSS